MKKFILILMAALMLVVYASAIPASAADPVVSPSPTIIPDGPTGTTRATTGPGTGSTTGGGGGTTAITTAKPGETQSIGSGDGDNATGGSTTGNGGETSTAKPDDSDTSPETGSSERLLGATVILVSGMAVAAFVEPKSKKVTQAD